MPAALRARTARPARAAKPSPPPVAPEAAPAAGPIVNGYTMEGLAAKIALIDFLDLTYRGGTAYKLGADSSGMPILVEHENEIGDLGGATSIMAQAQATTAGYSPDDITRQRVIRRRRIAAYDNRFRPIIDKFVSYLLGSPPKRHDTVAKEAERLDLDEWIDRMLTEGLKYTEAFIGFDAGTFEPGKTYTKAQLAVIDPKNQGQPYMVMVDPRRVVDYDEDGDEGITRIVIQETICTKASFTAPESKVTRFKEWTTDVYRIYEVVEETTKGEIVPVAWGGRVAPSGMKLRQVGADTAHTFGCCPFEHFVPPFPTEDLAELNRLLFNMGSLLDEEMFDATFTQKWVAGARPDDLRDAKKGTTNIICLQDPNAKLGTVGGQPGQAAAIMDRIRQLHESISELVSMQGTGVKNVAETDDKKRRDLEGLYTLLVKIIGRVEMTENRLLEKMDLITEENEDDLRTQYPRHFDVNSIGELMEEIADLATIPFTPPSFKRSIVLKLLNKLEPFGDHEAYAAEIKGMFDTTAALLDALANAAREGVVTPEMIAAALGLPEPLQADLIDTMTAAREAGLAADAAAAEGAANGAGNGTGGVVENPNKPGAPGSPGGHSPVPPRRGPGKPPAA